MMLPNNLLMAISEAIPLLRGWGGKTERPYRMAELIIKERPDTVVEIGVFGGQSLIPMAMALKIVGHGRIYGIDPYDLGVITEDLADMDDKEMWVRQDMKLVLKDTATAMEEFGLQNQVVMILGKSSNCSFLFDDIDILHIDGAHTEEGAMMDVLCYAWKVRRGGYIWMDDTHFPSLEKPLKELEHSADLVEDYGCYRLYRKR